MTGDGRPTDAELVADAALGDRDALGELYGRYARPVYGLALARLGEPAPARDAHERVFATVLAAVDGGAPDDVTSARWLFDIARATIGGEARAREWEAWRAHRALSSLTEHQRSAVELAYWGGLTAEETASFLGLDEMQLEDVLLGALTRLADVIEVELR